VRKLLAIMFVLVLTISSVPPTAGAQTGFKDVPRDHWAHDEIRFLTGKGVIRGFSNGTFKPLTVLTRKDAAIMLVRSLKWTAPAKPKLIPSDMKPTMSGYKEVLAAVDKGLFTLSGRAFQPNQPLTRKEMARALAVAFDYKGKGTSSFKDLGKSHPYYKYIDAIAENDVTSGYSDGTFKPDIAVNRAQFSVFLARIYSKPLEYMVKEYGKVLHQVRDPEEAIQLALRYEKATVHPVSHSLTNYPAQPGKMEKTGIRNGVLIYNGDKEGASFSPDYFKPYIAYKQGETYSGTMFDSFIILGRTYSGGEFTEASANHANYKEWKWYVDRTFASSGALANLNQSAKSLGKKVNVYLAIPYPKRNETIVTLDGKRLKNTPDERYRLVSWYRNQMESKWKAAGYSHLAFKGYYWLNETVISLEDELLVEKVAKDAHASNKTFIYSPHALTTNFENWKTYGFDGAYLQPNAFRASSNEAKAKLHRAFLRAQIYGSGMNIEIDSLSPHQIATGAENFRLYLEFAERYRLPGQSLIMYQATDMVHRMATIQSETYQGLYRELYEVLH